MGPSDSSSSLPNLLLLQPFKPLQHLRLLRLLLLRLLLSLRLALLWWLQLLAVTLPAAPACRPVARHRPCSRCSLFGIAFACHRCRTHLRYSSVPTQKCKQSLSALIEDGPEVPLGDMCPCSCEAAAADMKAAKDKRKAKKPKAAKSDAYEL